MIVVAENSPHPHRGGDAGEAVDEAIGRATEMGRPVLHLNGLDPLSTLSTIAAVNILGRIAKRVANYDSELMVPCFDPVVMTVSAGLLIAAGWATAVVVGVGIEGDGPESR